MKNIKIDVHLEIFSIFATQDYQSEIFLKILRKNIEKSEENKIIVDFSQVCLATPQFLNNSIGILMKELGKEKLSSKIRFKNPPVELKKLLISTI